MTIVRVNPQCPACGKAMTPGCETNGHHPVLGEIHGSCEETLSWSTLGRKGHSPLLGDEGDSGRGFAAVEDYAA